MEHTKSDLFRFWHGTGEKSKLISVETNAGLHATKKCWMKFDMDGHLYNICLKWFTKTCQRLAFKTKQNYIIIISEKRNMVPLEKII